MNVLVLLTTSILALIFLIIHSYLFRGARLTINFFTFAFIWAFMKETTIRYFILLPPPYEFVNNRIPIIFRVVIATIGWLFSFYLAWSLAERAIKRVKYFQDSLFAVFLLSGVIIASISYCIETTGIAVGWWHWIKTETRYMSDCFVGISPFVLAIWAFFGMHFLLPFFLIECSKFKKTYWKCIFFIIAFIRDWIHRFSGPGLTMALEMWFIIGLLFFLSLVRPLKLEYYSQGAEMPIGRFKFNRNTLETLDQIPIFASLFMLLILIIIDIYILHKPELLISCLPMVFFILLAIDKIPLLWLVFVAFRLILTFEKKFIITTIPIITILIFQAFSWIKENFNPRFALPRKEF